MTDNSNLLTDLELKPTCTVGLDINQEAVNFVGLHVYREDNFLSVTCPCNVTVSYRLHSIPRTSTRFPCENPNHWVIKYENEPENKKDIEQFLSSSFVSEDWKYEYNQDNTSLVATHENFGQRLICKFVDPHIGYIFGVVLANSLTYLSKKPVVSKPQCKSILVE